MRCLKRVALSPNIDAGGGLDVLLCALREHLDGASRDDALFRARALGKPPPAAALSFVRSATAVLCGKVPVERLLVKTARLRVGDEHGDSGGSAVDHLVNALGAGGLAGPSDERKGEPSAVKDIKTDGYILKILERVAKKCAQGRECLLATFLGDGLAKLDKLKAILANVTTLPEDNLERWRTHLRAIQLVNVLCETPEGDPLVVAFHAKFVKGAADDAQLHALLQAGLGKAGDVQAQVDDETAKLLARLRVA